MFLFCFTELRTVAWRLQEMVYLDEGN